MTKIDIAHPDAVRPAPEVRIVRTGPRGLGNPTSDFAALLRMVEGAGLLRRRRGFYLAMYIGTAALFIASWVAFALLRGTWYELIVAAMLGALFTQFAFLAHESAHRQVWRTGPVNDAWGRFLASFMVGISYAWWMTKHSRHHASPNTIDRDPDIDPDFILFQVRHAREARGVYGWLVQRQGWLFFPALTLEGLNLHMQAIRTVFFRADVEKRGLEITFILVRNVSYLAAVFAFLPLGMAFAFLGVQLAVFGLYMGASFAPNHKGMPQIPRDARVDFLRRQVLTSRNVKGLGTTTLMGGLNYQIEHHLFPSMPRPYLKKARVIVMQYCAEKGVSYTEATLFESFGIVIAYLNRVGLAARDPFDCPAAQAFGR